MPKLLGSERSPNDIQVGGSLVRDTEPVEGIITLGDLELWVYNAAGIESDFMKFEWFCKTYEKVPPYEHELYSWYLANQDSKRVLDVLQRYDIVDDTKGKFLRLWNVEKVLDKIA